MLKISMTNCRTLGSDRVLATANNFRISLCQEPRTELSDEFWQQKSKQSNQFSQTNKFNYHPPSKRVWSFSDNTHNLLNTL